MGIEGRRLRRPVRLPGVRVFHLDGVSDERGEFGDGAAVLVVERRGVSALGSEERYCSMKTSAPITGAHMYEHGLASSTARRCGASFAIPEMKSDPTRRTSSVWRVA